MCLAIPAKVLEIHNNHLATVEIFGLTRQVALDLIPQAAVGDFVLVHAGYGIEIVSEEFAIETFDLIRKFPEFVEFDW